MLKAKLSEPDSAPENKFQEVIYWAPASEYQLANFQEEERAHGSDRVTKREQPLRFVRNMFTARDQREVDFIESSNAYQAGIIKKCVDVQEALGLTQKHVNEKGATQQVKVETVVGTR